MSNETPVNDRYPLVTGESYLLSFQGEADFVPQGMTVRSGGVTADLSLIVGSRVSPSTYEILVDFALNGEGMRFEVPADFALNFAGTEVPEFNTGELWLRTPGYQPGFLTQDGWWYLNADFECEFLSDLLQRLREPERVSYDLFVTPRDWFTGKLRARGTIAASDGPAPSITLVGATISLTESVSRTNMFSSITIQLAKDQDNRQFNRLFDGRQEEVRTQPTDDPALSAAPGAAFLFAAAPAAAAPPCRSGDARNRRRLKVQMVRLKPSTGTADPILGLFQSQLAVATTIWGKACIDFDPQLDATRLNATLNMSDQIDAIAKIYSSPTLKAVEIFIVDNALSQYGGGATLDGNTDLAKVVISATTTDSNLLAHELGHVFGGTHPEEPLPGWWEGEWATILEANTPLAPANSRFNCLHANNSAFTVTDIPSCISPDEVA